MHRFLRRLRKGLKTACLAAALTTCWQIGQVAKAEFSPPNWGDEVTLQINGTVSPATNDLFDLYLIYGTNYSVYSSRWAVNLGDFTAGQSQSFSIEKTAIYLDGGMFWAFAGLYGDISGGEYQEGTNGVTLSINAAEGDSWDSHAHFVTEEAMFSYIFNGESEQLMYKTNNIYSWKNADLSDGVTSDTIDLFNFSVASANGQIQIQSEIVPEPVSIVLFGTGGMIVVALRRRNK